MSATRRPKGKTHFRYGWKLSSKAKALRFQPRSMMGAQETLSRVEMNAQLRGALDTVSRADAPVCLDNDRCRHTRNGTWKGMGSLYKNIEVFRRNDSKSDLEIKTKPRTRLIQGYQR